MSKPKNIKEFIGQFFLKRKLKTLKREKVITNFNLAQSVGIIFSIKNKADFNLVNDFVNRLINEKSLQICVVAYVEDASKIKYYSHTNFKLFTKQHLNWYGKPDIDALNFFIEKPFDILIDLSLTDIFPIEYMVATSVAKLKVGRFVEDGYYDFMIDVKKDNTIDNLIKQIELYLSIVNVNIYDR